MASLLKAKFRSPDPDQQSGEPLSCADVSWDTVADCRRCAVRQQALFSALRGSDFDHLLTLIRSAVVPAATQLYAQDESAKAIYTVRWGLVKLAKHTPEGGARIVRLLGPGAAVGLEAVEEGVYWHTAIALRETSLCRIPLKVVERLQGHNQQVAERLISQWERYVEYADRWITELSGGPVMPRVRRLMALLVEISGSAAGEVEVPSVEDLASILGASVESVSRAMAELKRGEVLTRVAPRTYRCDLDALNA